MWEPLIEKSSLCLDIDTQIEKDNEITRKINLNIFEYKQSIMNINISDLTVKKKFNFKICFFYSTLNSWIEKYMKLKNNYQLEVKKLIKDDKEIVISNHKIVNYSGRYITIYRKEKNKKDKIKLITLQPGKLNIKIKIKIF